MPDRMRAKIRNYIGYMSEALDQVFVIVGNVSGLRVCMGRSLNRLASKPLAFQVRKTFCFAGRGANILTSV